MRTITVRLRKLVTLILVTMVLTAGPVGAAQPQEFDPEFYTSVLTGIEIEVAGPDFAITGAELQHYSNGEGEVINIDSETRVAILEVSFFDDADTPQTTLDIYLASYESMATSFTVLDRGTNGEYHYALAVFTFMGEELVYYMQVFEDIDGNVDLFEAILTSPDLLESDIAAAQAEITIDGFPYMENVNPAQLGEVVLTGESSTPVAEEPPLAEPTETVDFSESDAYVSIGPDFSFIGGPQAGQNIESVQIQGPNSLIIVAVGQTGESPVAVADSFEEGIASVYPGADLVYEEFSSDQGWRILWVPKDDGPNTYLIIVANNTSMPGYELLHAHEVSADSVAGTLITIQSQVTINDQPLMPEIDPEEMAFYVERHAGEGDDSTQTPETGEGTAESEEERSSNPREDARLPDTTDDTGDETDETLGNTSETGGANTEVVEETTEPIDEASPESGDSAGVLTDSSWEGGVHGHLIEWDAATWFVDPNYPDDLVSDPEAQEDTIILQTGSPNGNAWLFISIYGESDITPLDYLDYWTSDEFLTDASAEVLDTRTRGGNAGAVIQYLDGNGDEYILVRQAVVLDDGSLMIITFDAPAADAVEMYEIAAEVTVDGDPALRIFSDSQIQRTVGD